MPTIPPDSLVLPSPPRSLLGWGFFLWNRVFFAGQPAPTSPSAIRYWLVLLAIPGLLLYPCLSFYLFEPDEGRYAQIPREMLTEGEWIIPTLQGEPYLDKPPLFYWLVMGSFSLFGYHEWAARLVPALAVHGTILLTFFLGRRSLGDRPGFLGALVLALAPAFIGMGRLLLLDGVFTFFVTLALFSALEALRSSTFRVRWWLLSALACGLGILTKGPVTLILLIPPLWLYRRLTETHAPLRWRDLGTYAAIVLAVNLPWYLVACLRLPDFAYHFFWEHNIVRFLQPFAHNNPVWFYLPILLVGMLPATFLLVPFVHFLTSADPETVRSRPPALGFFLLAAGWCVLFFTLSEGKLPTYILPALPPLCLAGGCFLHATRWGNARATRLGMAATAGLLLVLHYGVVPWVARARSPMNNPEEVRSYCGDPEMPVRCYPRNLDSVAFYLGRDDLKSFRSKHTHLLVEDLLKEPRTVVLFGHRNSLTTLSLNLPPELRLVRPTKLGLCDMAVVERVKSEE